MSTARMMPAATSVAPAPVSPTTAGTTASATITAAIGCAMGGPFTIEVGFLVWKIAAALNGYRRHVRDSSFVVDFAAAFYSTSAHFRSLLFEHGFARQADTISFDCQHFHQYLVALFQLVTNILDAMLRHFADVQQAVSTRKNFDKRAKICQPRDLAQVSLPDLGCRGQIANNLQGLVRRGLVV